jgi:hypothetical protein
MDFDAMALEIMLSDAPAAVRAKRLAALRKRAAQHLGGHTSLSLRRNPSLSALRLRVASLPGEIANIAATMETRLTYAARNAAPDAWLRTALLEETQRLDTAAKHLRRLLERASTAP